MKSDRTELAKTRRSRPSLGLYALAVVAAVAVVATLVAWGFYVPATDTLVPPDLLPEFELPRTMIR